MARFSRSDFRLFLFGLFMLMALGIIIVRLWVVQVIDHEKYAKRVGSHSELSVRIPSVRGEIRDRNGIPLVQNRASYNVDFYLPDMVSGYRKRMGSLPLLNEQRNIHGMKRDVDVSDVIKIVNTGVIPRLQELDLARDYNAARLKKHYDTNSLVPFTYIEDVDFPTIAKFSEHDVGLPGVDISVKPVREYLYGAFAAHILGYVGMPVDINELPDVRKFNFYQPDVEGKAQIEKAMDVYLRGKPGVRILKRNAKNIIEDDEHIVAPEPGANVYLTIDARIQYIVEQALRHPSIGRGAAVVVDPNNGDILAMASVPSFDPNIFIPSVSTKDWTGLMKDEAVPLVNRAVSGFPPGSTFKIVTAMAGATKGLANQKFTCNGGIQYGNHYFKCWIAKNHGRHGSLGLSDALKVSCNCFFYQMGNAAGGEAMERVGGIVGMGHRYDHLGLSDQKEGIMPGPARRRERYANGRWTSGDSANTSIGQGSVLASPLQMALAYAMVANGGTAYEPRLVKKVLHPDGTPVRNEDGSIAVPDEPTIRYDLHQEMSPEQIEELRRGLWKVVNERGGAGGNGTGSKGKVPGWETAGKTGTAQASNKGQPESIAWFCSFVPYDNPRYAIAVMIPGGGGGGAVAAPVSAHILKQCMELESGKLTVALKPLAPAHSDHPNAPIAALPDYDTLAATSADVDPSDTVQTAPASDVQMSSTTASERPDIRPEADERGRVRRATAVRSKPTPTKKAPVVRRAVPVKPTERKREEEAQPAERDNFFQRMFGPRRPSHSKPTPPPQRGSRH
ncbi:MAG TPA: penicillin-binding protein 2 [Chthoniobacteraceae bacterium]|nr:penicillin-binding protein 2 [Chthoniobacteraceae bacterium]